MIEIVMAACIGIAYRQWYRIIKNEMRRMIWTKNL